MTYGTVTWFNPRRGIGAVSVDGSGRVIPVGSTDIDGCGRQSLRGGDRVAFTLLDGPGGTRAARVWVP